MAVVPQPRSGVALRPGNARQTRVVAKGLDRVPAGLLELSVERSNRFLVGETARTMIVYEEGTELYRQPVRLRVEGGNSFRP